MKRIILAALVGVLVSGPVLAEPRRLNEAEIIAFTQGGPYLGTSRDGYPYNLEFHKNGTMDGTSGSAMDDGTWEVVKDTLCFKWENWRSAARYCFSMKLWDDGSLFSYKPDGSGMRRSEFTGKVDWPKPTTTPITTPPPSAISPTVKTPQRQGDSTIEERLTKLRELLDKGLLTPDEAAAKRREILKGL